MSDDANDKKNEPIIKPDVTSDFAADVAIKLFNITAVVVKELVSYDDRNFYLKCDDGKEFILKASNAMETENRAYEFQNKVMTVLHKDGLKVQLPLPSVNGNQAEVIAIETRISTDGARAKREHAFRVLSFLPGSVLDDEKVRVDVALLRDFGATLARVDRTLSRELPDLQPPEDMLWSLRSVPKLRDFVFAVSEASDRDIVLSVITDFEREVLPRMASLTTGVIHGDPNEQNLIVRQRTPSTQPPTYELVGLLDWQDCHSAPIIFDLAMLCSYIMIAHKATWDPDLDVLCVPAAVIEGFCSEWRLPESELRLLPTLILARLVQSLCLGAYTYHVLDPTNDYLLVTARTGWRLLRLLCDTDREVLMKKWNLS